MPECSKCHTTNNYSSYVAVILVFFEDNQRPFPLIPAEDYAVCMGCNALTHLVVMAIDANPRTKGMGSWDQAIVLFADGTGSRARRKSVPAVTQKEASA